MKIAKAQLVKLVEDLYRLALRERLEAAEDDIREGRVLSEEEVEAEIARWFSE